MTHREDRVRLIDVAATMVELFDLSAPELPGRSLMRNEGDRTVVSQIGWRSGYRWRSIRIGEGEVHDLPHGRRKTAGFSSAGADETSEVSREAQAEIHEAAVLLDELAPWPRRKRTRARLTQEERRNLRALGYRE